MLGSRCRSLALSVFIFRKNDLMGDMSGQIPIAFSQDPRWRLSAEAILEWIKIQVATKYAFVPRINSSASEDFVADGKV